MIDERSEPDTTKEIEYEIHPSEHPSDEDRMCLEIEPEGDRKPDEHIRESSDCSVDEDMGEEVRVVHFRGLIIFDSLSELRYGIYTSDSHLFWCFGIDVSIDDIFTPIF